MMAADCASDLTIPNALQLAGDTMLVAGGWASGALEGKQCYTRGLKLQ